MKLSFKRRRLNTRFKTFYLQDRSDRRRFYQRIDTKFVVVMISLNLYFWCHMIKALCVSFISGLCYASDLPLKDSHSHILNKAFILKIS